MNKVVLTFFIKSLINQHIIKFKNINSYKKIHYLYCRFGTKSHDGSSISRND